MPRKGAATRGRQLATLSGMAHTRFISEEMGHAIERAGSEELTFDQQVNLREISWSHKRAGKLPTSLVKALAETSSAAIEVWMQARADNDFPSLPPGSKNWLNSRKKALKPSAMRTNPTMPFWKNMNPALLPRIYPMCSRPYAAPRWISCNGYGIQRSSHVPISSKRLTLLKISAGSV